MPDEYTLYSPTRALIIHLRYTDHHLTEVMAAIAAAATAVAVVRVVKTHLVQREGRWAEW